MFCHPACQTQCQYAKELDYARRCDPFCFWLAQEQNAFELVAQFHQPVPFYYNKHSTGEYMDANIHFAFTVWLVARTAKPKDTHA